jgi:hypothetical protein
VERSAHQLSDRVDVDVIAARDIVLGLAHLEPSMDFPLLLWRQPAVSVDAVVVGGPRFFFRGRMAGGTSRRIASTQVTSTTE